jgi:histidyl-tRNA synthetase
VLIAYFDASRLGDYHRLARELRQQGFGVEVFPESTGLGKQLKYADRKGHRVALIAGSQEFAEGVWQVKDLKSGSATKVPATELANAITSILASM